MKTESRYADYDRLEFAVVTPQRAAAEALRDVAFAPPAIDLGVQSQAEIEAAIGAWAEDWWSVKRRADAALAEIDPWSQPTQVVGARTSEELWLQGRELAESRGEPWISWADYLAG